VVSDTMLTILYTDLIPGRGGNSIGIFHRHPILSALGFLVFASDILVSILLGTNKITAQSGSFVGALYIIQTGTGNSIEKSKRKVY